MKTAIARLTGIPVIGDFVILGYRSKRGGQTFGRYDVRDGDDIQTVARGIATSFTAQTSWMDGNLEATSKGDAVVLKCSPMVGDIDFFAEVGAIPLGRENPIGVTIDEF